MEKNVKTGFFSALLGVCCGTAIFPQLLRNTRSRALWHLFLMSLLCTVLLSIRTFPQLRGEYKSVAKRYIEVFGQQVEFSEAGIRPEEELRPRHMRLPRSGYLVYTAHEKKITLPDDWQSTAEYIVVWNSNFIAIAVTGDHKHWDVLLGRPHRQNERRHLDRDNLISYFDEELTRPNSRENWSLPERTMRAEDVFEMANFFHSAWWFIFDWLGNFLLGLILTGICAVVAKLSGAATARGLTGWQYWQVGVYAGFPGMLIGSVAAALELPILSYGIAYALALVIYWLPAALACSKDHERGGGMPAA